MKLIKIKSSKHLVLGMLLFGSASFVNAQETTTTEQVQTQPQTNAAIEALKKLVEANPKDNESLVKLAAAYQENKDWKNALETWKKVNTALPEWSPAYYSQGYVYQSMKDIPNAAVAYQKYISLVKPEELEASKKNVAFAHFFIAYSQFETNKDEAKKNIAKSLEYDPSNPEAVKLKEALDK